ncbi:hydrogenase maturation nickel metallochaperone HypA [Haladaptatus salinisoli]|nr:hydrogenase maturation nickel metallochaperone HypA [Haladaptatus salinisoli]
MTRVVCDECGTEQTVTIFSPKCSVCGSEELTVIDDEDGTDSE